MKRNSVLGLLVFCNKEFTIVGTVKEIKLYDKEMKIKYFIINDKTLDKSFILPFKECYFKDAVLHCSREALIEIDNLEFYKEIRKCKELFSYKNVFDENEQFIGKISDYSFNDKTGELEDIYYYNYDKEENSIIQNQIILNQTINNILNKKNEDNTEKDKVETKEIEEEDLSKNEDTDVQSENVLDTDTDIDKIKEITEELFAENQERIKLFKSKIEEEHENLKNIYLDLQKEIKEEFDSMMIYIENKIENLFNTDLKTKEEDFINKISEIYKQQSEEIVKKAVLVQTLNKTNNTRDLEETSKDIQKNEEVQPDPKNQDTVESKQTNEQLDFNRRVEDKEIFIEESEKISNIYKIMDIKKQTEDELPKIDSNETHVQQDKIELNIKPITESTRNSDILVEEKNEKLEKLYQLQAKRMSIIDKMLKTKEY